MSQADQPDQWMQTFAAVVHHLADEYRRGVTTAGSDEVAEILKLDRELVGVAFMHLANHGYIETAGDGYLLANETARISRDLKCLPLVARLLPWLPSPPVVGILLWTVLIAVAACVLVAIWTSVDWSGSPHEPSAVAPGRLNDIVVQGRQLNELTTT